MKPVTTDWKSPRTRVQQIDLLCFTSTTEFSNLHPVPGSSYESQDTGEALMSS